MPELTITLNEQSMQRLKFRATEAGVEPEELLRTHVEQWLASQPDDFSGAAAYVLRKNAELYRRLAG
ncbi:MAG: DNA-binding protein [Armatimonadota bacterium]|nr:DNA-binding protein [Armatimonadota bacterium]